MTHPLSAGRGERIGRVLVPYRRWEIVEPLIPPQRERPQGGGTRLVGHVCTDGPPTARAARRPGGRSAVAGKALTRTQTLSRPATSGTALTRIRRPVCGEPMRHSIPPQSRSTSARSSASSVVWRAPAARIRAGTVAGQPGTVGGRERTPRPGTGRAAEFRRRGAS